MNPLNLAGGYFSREAFIKLLALTLNIDNRATSKRVERDILFLASTRANEMKSKGYLLQQFSCFMTLGANKRQYFVHIGVLDKEIMHQSQATLNLDSTKKEKDLDRLLKICNSTQDVLRRQEEQQKEIQNCKNKIHFMTQELETMQTKTKRENSLDKVRWFINIPLAHQLRQEP